MRTREGQMESRRLDERGEDIMSMRVILSRKGMETGSFLKHLLA